MFKSKSIKLTYHGINLFMFGVLAFLTPLIFVTSTNELFEFPKTHFLYIWGSTIIFLFFIKQTLYPKKLIMPHKLILGWLFVYVIATVLSSHLYTSMWGYYTRFHGGLISVLILFGIYFVSLNVLLPKDYKVLFKLFTFTIIPSGIYALIQHYSPGVSAVRVTSTLGQPNWFGAYIGMLLPIILLQIIKFSQKVDQKIFWSVLFTLGFAALWFTYSLSGILGAVAGIVMLLILERTTAFTNRNLLFLASISIFCIIFAFVNLGFFERRVNDLLLDFQRFITYQTHVFAQNESYSVSDTGFIRSGMWKGTLNLIFSHPKVFLIGTGPETFPYEFQKYRVPELNYSSEWDYILNKPHNYYLEVWSQLGLFGLIVYVAVGFWILRTKNSLAAPSTLTLFISNIFGWPTVATALLFWIILAYLQGEQT